MLLSADVAEAFGVLSLPLTATEEEVKKAYKSIAKLAHPDSPGGSDEAMKKVNAAYEKALEFIAQRKPERCICRGFTRNQLCKSSIHDETPAGDDQCSECGGTKKVMAGTGFTKISIDCPKCS